MMNEEQLSLPRCSNLLKLASSILQEQKYFPTTSRLHILLHRIAELNSKVLNTKTKLKLQTGVGNEFLRLKCGKNMELRNLKSRKIKTKRSKTQENLTLRKSKSVFHCKCVLTETALSPSLSCV